jgi:hypothetical protein
MKYVKTRIVNCKSASIRLAPWDAERSKEIVGIRDGPHEEDGSITAGTVIDINPQEVCYDWTGRKFYKVRNPEGWIYEGVVDYVGEG